MMAMTHVGAVYVGSKPLNGVDPFGLARFGFRPLGDGTDRFEPDDVPDGSSNHHNAHEQLWFDDISTDNVGFFAGDGNESGWSICGENGDVRSDNGHTRYQYSFFGPVYDDKLMRTAVENVRPNWDGNAYCVVGNNCQHFSDALRVEYQRLYQEQTINRIRSWINQRIRGNLQ